MLITTQQEDALALLLAGVALEPGDPRITVLMKLGDELRQRHNTRVMLNRLAAAVAVSR